MASPAPKRPRRSIPVKDVMEMVLDSDDTDIPDGSDDENLSDDEGEDYESLLDTESSGEEEGFEDSVSISDVSTASGSSSVAPVKTWHWIKRDLPPSVRPVNELKARGPALTARTPLEMFRAHFDEEIMETLVLESNRKRLALGRTHVQPITLDELQVFVGICLYMSIVDLPFRRMYWAPATRQADVADNMTVNRFEEILSLLHLNDNVFMQQRGHPNFDPLFKIRPLVDKLNNNFEKCTEKENCCH